jgi:hypothetical protein
VVDRVARSTPETQKLGAWTLPLPDAGNVLVTHLIDLGCAHHHVPLTRPEHVKHPAVRVPRLDELMTDRRAHRMNAVDEHGFSVGQHGGRNRGRLGEPPPDGRNVADGVDQDLAVFGKGVGTCRYADVCS